MVSSHRLITKQNYKHLRSCDRYSVSKTIQTAQIIIDPDLCVLQTVRTAFIIPVNPQRREMVRIYI